MKTGAPRFKPGKILDALGAMQNSLTRSAQRIAAYILAQPAQVTQLSIADLSALTQAGEATIIRFCRTLGYKGFQDFKMEMPMSKRVTIRWRSAANYNPLSIMFYLKHLICFLLRVLNRWSNCCVLRIASVFLVLAPRGSLRKMPKAN